MRIAFVGGKGSGKSTCAAVFGRHLAAKGLPVLAVDAAADRRLTALLGRQASPCWSREHLRGVRQLVALGPDGLGAVDGPPTCPSARAVDGVRLVATDAPDVLLDHLADGPGEYVVVDLASDGAASRRYDLTVLVSEPIRRCGADGGAREPGRAPQMQQGHIPTTGSQKCAPAVVGVAESYSASSR